MYEITTEDHILGFKVTKSDSSHGIQYILKNDDGTVDYTFSKEFFDDALETVGSNALIEAFVGIINKKILPPLRIRRDFNKVSLIADYVISTTDIGK